MTQTGSGGPLLLPLREKKAFLPSAGGKSANLEILQGREREKTRDQH